MHFGDSLEMHCGIGDQIFLLKVNLGALSVVEIYLLVCVLSVIDNLRVMINVNVVVECYVFVPCRNL